MYISIAVTYLRCPSFVPSYNQYCFVILISQDLYSSAAYRCSLFSGVPVWFSSVEELEWMRNMLVDIGINCFHLGMPHDNNAITRSIVLFSNMRNLSKLAISIHLLCLYFRLKMNVECLCILQYHLIPCFLDLFRVVTSRQQL